MISSAVWIFIFCALCLSTFGLWFCLLVLLSVISAAVGFLLFLYVKRDVTYSFEPKTLRYHNPEISPFIGIPKFIMKMKQRGEDIKQNQFLTGYMKVDENLQEIIKYIIRDYISSWYKHVSSNNEFEVHISTLFSKVICALALYAKEVQWVTFFTRQIVEDFASHLRLYKQAEKAFRKVQKEKSKESHCLESIFFDLELNMEKTVCHDYMCTSEDNEKRYLRDLSDILLYLLLPEENYNNKIMRTFLKELCAVVILYPMISLLSDPDYINQNLVWLCKDYILTSKAFLTVIRRTDSIDELAAVEEILKHELKVQKSKDDSNKDDIKQHIKSITFVQDVVQRRYQFLSGSNESADADSADFNMDIDIKSLMGPDSEVKFISLPFDIILDNNIGLYYFTEFLTSIGAQGYIYFFHNIEGYRASVEMILIECENEEFVEQEKKEKLKQFAMQLFEAYLGKHAVTPVNLDEAVIFKLYQKIETESLSENCFDEIQEKVYDVMQNKFYTEFKSSSYYVKLLAELDLLNEFSSKDNEILSSNKSNEEDEKSDCDNPILLNNEVVISELRSFKEAPCPESFITENVSKSSIEKTDEVGIIAAEIYNTGITHHAGKTFAVYAIAVSHFLPQGYEERWFVVRRYREFYDFHEGVIEKYPQLVHLSFPSKKAFNNLSRQVMERRRQMLNEYIQSLLSLETLQSCNGLKFMIYEFLQPRVCEEGKKSFIRTVGTLVSPIKTSVKTVGSMVKLVPGTLFGLKDGLVKALSRNTNPDDAILCLETDKVSAGLDLEADDIPFRVLLLLVDEIFDLRNKDLWFRRRIIFLLRHIIKTMQGGSINRKIEEYVRKLTSASQVAELLKKFSQSFWPNGVQAEPAEERDYNCKMRTRIAAKTLLLCSIPDEVKHIIGNETSFKGAMLIFNAFQYPSLNRRLIYVFLESLLKTLFPHNKFSDLFRKLHSKSPRLITKFSSEEYLSSENTTPVLEKNEFNKKTSTNSKFFSRRKFKFKLKSDKNPSEMNRTGELQSSHISDNTIKPKSSKKRKKSVKKALFYVEQNISEDSDTVPSPNIAS